MSTSSGIRKLRSAYPWPWAWVRWFTGMPSAEMLTSVPWSRLKPRKKYWLALPSPVCWVTTKPGTDSSTSAGRDHERRSICSRSTIPSVAEGGFSSGADVPVMTTCGSSFTPAQMALAPSPNNPTASIARPRNERP
ncbi:MAG: hypothetical protein Q8M12_01205 [bacterium]|nr:hypothetical protein [bacterium]